METEIEARDVVAASEEVNEGLRDIEIGGSERYFEQSIVVGGELDEAKANVEFFE